MIGVGITTRNRPEILDYALGWFAKFQDRNQDILVVDDNSDIDVHETLGEKYPHISFMYNQERLGIAKSKNELIKGFLDTGWEYDGFVLFDDDAFPTQEGWYEHFLRARKNHNQQHMIFAKEPQIVLESSREYADIWCGCLGVCVWLTPYAVQRIGGWDPRFKRYGMEHHELTRRCYLAKLSPLGLYVSPKDISDYIWCFDTNGDHVSCDCGWNGKYIESCPECGDPLILNEDGFKWPHKGCMTKEERDEAIAENGKIFVEIKNEKKENLFRKI